MMSKNARFVLAAIVLLHAILALLFAVNTPFRAEGVVQYLPRNPQTGLREVVKDIGAPDERQHTNYVRRIATGQGFPVFDAKDPDFYETFQSHQPPLYYVLAAGWSKAFAPGISESPENRFRVNPAAGVGLRCLNVLFGSLTLFGIFLIGLWGHGSEKVGLIAAGFAGSMPMFCALSGAVSNDPLLFGLCTFCVAMFAKNAKDGWNIRSTALIGVLIGCALITKTTALALWPTLAVTVFVSRDRNRALQLGALAFGISVIVAAPWWLRNQSLYGDPLALRAFSNSFGGTAQASTFIDGFGPWGYWGGMVAWWTSRAFIGIFGYMDICLNERGVPNADTPNTLYRLLLAVIVVAIFGYFASLRKLPKDNATDNSDASTHWICGAFSLVVVMLFLKFNAQYFQAQARYIYPAIGPISCAFAIGAMHILKGKFRVALGLTVTLFGATSLYALSVLPSEFSKRMAPQVPIAVSQPSQ